MKDLNPFKTVLKVQGASSILRMGFALSKYPHFNSAYLIRVPFSSGIAVSSGLPKAEGLRPKSKVSHLRLRLRLPKVYAVEGRRSGRRLKFFEIQ